VHELTPIEVIVFPGGFNWPLWAAYEQGFFARERLDVRVTFTPTSVFQLTNLIGGTFDIGLTAMDNVVACREDQADGVPAKDCDLFAFMGGDDGLLHLVVQPEIRTYADLREKELSVDALTTGYAFVLRDMLERGGLQEGDYTLAPAGGVAQRWEALREGKHAGTLLVTPFELLAQSAGLRCLANAAQVLGRYQGLVGTTRHAWARKHQRELVGFIRAYRAGLRWIFDSANRNEALALLKKNVRGMTPDLVTRAADVLLGAGGFDPTASMDMEGVNTVLRLRSRFGRPRKTLSDPARYCDLSYYQEAASESP
jgi:ABC-type nitrate/sulfonate/bicarbonate transport system substrate-binding protein